MKNILLCFTVILTSSVSMVYGMEEDEYDVSDDRDNSYEGYMPLRECLKVLHNEDLSGELQNHWMRTALYAIIKNLRQQYAGTIQAEGFNAIGEKKPNAKYVAKESTKAVNAELNNCANIVALFFPKSYRVSGNGSGNGNSDSSGNGSGNGNGSSSGNGNSDSSGSSSGNSNSNGSSSGSGRRIDFTRANDDFNAGTLALEQTRSVVRSLFEEFAKQKAPAVISKAKDFVVHHIAHNTTNDKNIWRYIGNDLSCRLDGIRKNLLVKAYADTTAPNEARCLKTICDVLWEMIQYLSEAERLGAWHKHKQKLRESASPPPATPNTRVSPPAGSGGGGSISPPAGSGGGGGISPSAGTGGGSSISPPAGSGGRQHQSVRRKLRQRQHRLFSIHT